MTKRLGPILLAVAAALSVPVASSAVEIRLTNGDVIQAISVEPAPFDMVRITMPDGTYDYLAPVKIRAVIDDTGADRTKALFRDRETIGTPLPPEQRVPGPGLRVGPRSVTNHFAITETTLMGRVGSESVLYPASFDFDMGVMWNVADRSAIGGTAFVGSGGQYDFKTGVRLRYRRWFSRTASVDVAPGITALGREISGYPAHPPAYSLQVSLNPSRYVSLTTEVFSARHRKYHSRYWEEIGETGVMAGVRIGQWPGAVAGVLPILTSLFTSSVQVIP
jgi:hypothetical protein